MNFQARKQHPFLTSCPTQSSLFRTTKLLLDGCNGKRPLYPGVADSSMHTRFGIFAVLLFFSISWINRGQLGHLSIRKWV